MAESTQLLSSVEAQQSAADTDGAIVGGAEKTYASATDLPDGDLVGKLSIPALRLAVPIVQGLSKEDLLRGIGHVPGSATVGGLGNMALAAHRDTFFRPLRNIRPNMKILLTGKGGTYEYQVDSTEIVTPEEVSVLEIGTIPQVTLITCYPFDYIGAAPKRFIVHAHLISLVPVEPVRFR